jgi:hypothetical protein
MTRRDKQWADSRQNYAKALADLMTSATTPVTEKRDLSGIRPRISAEIRGRAIRLTPASERRTGGLW